MAPEQELWIAVIAQLLRDMREKVNAGKPTLAIEESSKSDWMRQICGFANIDHGWILDLIKKLKAH